MMDKMAKIDLVNVSYQSIAEAEPPVSLGVLYDSKDKVNFRNINSVTKTQQYHAGKQLLVLGNCL